MKKIIAVLALVIACQSTFAQSAKDLFEQFKNKEGVEYVNVSPLMMKLSRFKSFRQIKGIKSVKMLDMDDCSAEVKKDFQKEMEKLSLNGYETLVQTKEDGETVKLIAKMNEEAISELLMVITSDDECEVELLKGKIKKEDIQVLITDDNIMIDGRK